MINAALRNTALQVAAQFISLHTGDPGLTGANEVSGNAYARVAAPAFIAPTAGGTLGEALAFGALRNQEAAAWVEDEESELTLLVAAADMLWAA